MVNAKLLVLITSATAVIGSASLGHSPMGSAPRGPATIGLRPTPIAMPLAPQGATALELPESHVMVLEPGQDASSHDLEQGFVVVRRADGSVPRAYLWDEPLGCPKPRIR